MRLPWHPLEALCSIPGERVSFRKGYTTAMVGPGPGMRPMPGLLRFMLLWSQPEQKLRICLHMLI
jgi:hypothetical protein